ncbi:MAG: diadenylate cyclase CdaA [Aminobacterium sp.]|jgi:diadenylate cyclase|uniref:diadenylate cyclase CdaA n=1 Tax=unclassified Aminobacterium TaxID=2685012 RepID=UPI001BD0D302|nr:MULTISPECIES: diadenylate cyclase CdaA [unclassified Aminobacterium]MDD2206552.1 diadenylate cyclase CdaA [Aminobacterium sp.]MDD3707348.1 diadenylate cyclase CdaA [Aminobacterium sp.]MDD4228471.1 diadenylate cyclase CdaA [Aminobacterium sp.]MDD4551394.1 diadenylate cyclase CdaA [Aminobacterium sp.]MEA4878149.1 diadenylate cyclase CdaA [Aminobacterium sp.]
MLDLFRWHDILDIVIIAVIIHRLLLLLVGTRAMQLVKGLLILGVVASLARFFELRTLSWFLGKVLGVLIIAIPIVFQPELRRMLEELGRGNIWRRKRAQKKAEALSQEITRALGYLKGQKIGALMVLQRETGLRDFWSTAVKLNAEISQELIIAIFWPDNPLHDGAVIIDRDMIISAGTYLPLTENTDLSRWIGTRHRAALGVTEVSDAIALIVSEERGEISLAINGHLSRNLKENQVYKLLLHYFGAEEKEKRSFLDRIHEDIRSLWQ